MFKSNHTKQPKIFQKNKYYPWLYCHWTDNNHFWQSLHYDNVEKQFQLNLIDIPNFEIKREWSKKTNESRRETWPILNVQRLRGIHYFAHQAWRLWRHEAYKLEKTTCPSKMKEIELNFFKIKIRISLNGISISRESSSLKPNRVQDLIMLYNHLY